jgi:hypothetical protein
VIGAASGIDAESGYYFDDTKRYIDANPALSDSAIYPCNVPLSLQEDFHNMIAPIRHILHAVFTGYAEVVVHNKRGRNHEA